MGPGIDPVQAEPRAERGEQVSDTETQVPEGVDPETGEILHPDEAAVLGELSPDSEGEPDEDAPESAQEAAGGTVSLGQGLTPETMERRFKASESAVTAYAKKLSVIWEEDYASLYPCPLCPDIHKGFVSLNDAGRVPEEIQAGVMQYFGFSREVDYEQDGRLETCNICKGLGKTKTGSKVPGNDTTQCTNCKGYGFYPPPGAELASGVSPDPEHHPVGENVQPLVEGEVDAMNEPRILPDGRVNPNFGKWPQYKIQVAPYGVTAGLNAVDAA